MFGMNARYYLLYYIDMSIINYKNKMIIPLFELERIKKINFNQTHKNIIQKRYWNLMKLYDIVLFLNF